MSSALARTARYGRDFFIELVSLPIWWVTGGVVTGARAALRAIGSGADAAGVHIWLKNILVPMYGQHDAWGRIISFLIRLGNVIGRTVWVAVWSVVVAALYGVFLALPLAALYVLVSAVGRIAAVG